MLPGKRDFYCCCKARRSASPVNKEFWQQFKNYAPPSLRVIRTKFARTIIIYIKTRNVLLSAQMGERASVVLIGIITSYTINTYKLIIIVYIHKYILALYIMNCSKNELF